MNNKGFAVSGIIYSILILFLLLLFSILSIMGARKMVLDKLKNDVMNELNDTGDSEIVQDKSLISLLLKQYKPDNTTGLVKDSTNGNLYYYTGNNSKVSNNFLWYGGFQWRVLEFDTNAKTLTLITQQPLTSIQPTSVVWTTKELYESSYINTWLNEYFWNSLDSDIQANIVDSTFNIGMYTDVDEITTTQKVGMLDKEQYERAGNANSFLDIKTAWRLATRYSSSNSTNNLYYVGGTGNIYTITHTNTAGIRAVIKILDINIDAGNGTLTDSYRMASKATNTGNIQVGEYINVPYSGSDNACGNDNLCTFRVVSKDNDSVKIILNGLLPNESQFGSSPIITTNSTIYIQLNSFASGISNSYRYTANKTFYIGDYPYVEDVGQNYKVVQDETFQSNIGLSTVGEMFSGNDINLGASKTFVDINTIENPTASDFYWLINRPNSHDGIIIGYQGWDSFTSSTNDSIGVRPVMFLKSGLFFTGGEGTAQSPFTLE